MKEKVRTGFYLDKQMLDDIDHALEKSNKKSRNEFVAAAIKFYLGYVNEESNVNYLSPMITRTINAHMSGTEQRLSRMMFKIAVELGKVSNITAAMNGVDNATLQELNKTCINEVRRLNGIIELEAAMKYQHE
jgi:metal-responsive CopG/Arc/MetJ family transcriptional regulator